jgi:bifunctional DNA-binding transcriptional regulator/antitoxin component of YhaV-PrlF toxin-antitoxin module
MKYVTGKTDYEYLIAGKVIPKQTYNLLELERGKRAVLILQDEDYNKLCENAVFAAMVKAGSVEVSDKMPEDKKSETQTKTENNELLAQNERLMKELQEAKKDLGELTAAYKKLEKEKKK